MFQNLLETWKKPPQTCAGLNSCIRFKRPEVTASLALRKPGYAQCLAELAELYERRYQYSHISDGHYYSGSCLRAAARATFLAAFNPSLDTVLRLGSSACHSLGRFWDNGNDVRYLKRALTDGKTSIDLINKISLEDIATLEPTFVASVYHSTATGYALKHTGECERRENKSGLSMKEERIESLKSGIGILNSCEDSDSVRTLLKLMLDDMDMYRDAVESRDR